MEHPLILVTQWQYASVKKQMSAATLEVRIEMARNLARECRALGITVVGITDEESRKYFNDLTLHCIVTADKGIGPPRRCGFTIAAFLVGFDLRGVIGWTEPEKVSLVPDIKKCSELIWADDADFVMPFRTDAGIDSYPIHQIPWERKGNLDCSIIFGTKFPLIRRDFFFAPFFCNTKALRHFLWYPESQSALGQNQTAPDLWDSIYVPRMDAYCSGIRFAEVESQFRYPLEQRDAETVDYTIIPKRTFAMHNIVSSLAARRQWWEQQGFDFGQANVSDIERLYHEVYP